MPYHNTLALVLYPLKRRDGRTQRVINHRRHMLCILPGLLYFYIMNFTVYHFVSHDSDCLSL
jgi:hypothetical protein